MKCFLVIRDYQMKLTVINSYVLAHVECVVMLSKTK